MTNREHFTWIGPLTSDDAAGCVARHFVAGLARVGAAVSALDTGDGARPAPGELDAAVHAEGTTVVRQGPLSALADSWALVPAGRGARDVAYAVVDVPELDPRTRELLASCDEVWAPNFAQAELLAALGVPRTRLRVIVPGADALPVAASAPGGKPRVLVVGGSVPEVGGAACVAAHAPPSSAAFAEEVQAADAVVLRLDPDPWGHTVLALGASAKPCVCLASGAALEFWAVGDCTWLSADEAASSETISTAIASLVKDWPARVQLARRAGARRASVQGADASVHALLQRHEHPHRLERECLSRVLGDLGLPTPDEHLATARPRVEIVPVESVDGPWAEVLQTRIAKARSDATVVVWLDEAMSGRLDRVTARAEEALARSGRDPAEIDVLVVSAPLAHAPREHLVTIAA